MNKSADDVINDVAKLIYDKKEERDKLYKEFLNSLTVKQQKLYGEVNVLNIDIKILNKMVSSTYGKS